MNEGAINKNKIELSSEEKSLYIKVLGSLSAYNLGKYSELSIEEVKKRLEDLGELELVEKFKEKFSSTSSFLNDEEKNREFEKLERVALMVFDKSTESGSLK